MQTYEVTLDMRKTLTLAEDITVRVGDENTQEIVATITSGGAPWAPPPGVSGFRMRLQIENPAGRLSRSLATGSSDTWRAIIPPQAYTRAGITKRAYFSASWTDSAGKRCEETTQGFTLKVLPGTTDADDVKAYDEELDNLLNRLGQEGSDIQTAEAARVAAELERERQETQRKADEEARRSAEAERQAAEAARKASEETREGHEATRVSDEEERIQAETERKEAEAARKAAEAARESAEASRVEAEEARVSEWTTTKEDVMNTFGEWTEEEKARQEAEEKRISNEEEREEAEAARKDAETARAQAEAERASAETGRSAQETARESAEAAREAAEGTRNKAETAREEAEEERSTTWENFFDDATESLDAWEKAEEARESAEDERRKAEAERESAEVARDAAEEERESHESAREAAEGLRASSEAQRQTAETERAQAETRREEAEDARVEAEATRKAQWEDLYGEATSSFDDWTKAEEERAAAEARRQAAEDTRQSAEDARDEAFEEAIENAKNATDEALEAAEKANSARPPLIYAGEDVTQAGGFVEGQRDGDFYINTDTHEYFQLLEGVWTYLFTLDGGGGGDVKTDLALAVLLDNVKEEYVNGDTVHYSVNIQNPTVIGLYDLHGTVTLGELQPGPGYSLSGNAMDVDELRPGSTVTVKGTYPVTYADYGTEKAVSATVGNNLISRTAKSQPIPFADYRAELSMDKRITTQAEDGVYYVGDTITYETSIRNAGNVPLSNVEATPSLAGETTKAGSGYRLEGNTAKIEELEALTEVKVTSEYTIPEDRLGQTVTSTSVYSSDETGGGKSVSAPPIQVSPELRSLTIEAEITNDGTGTAGVFVEGDPVNVGITLRNPEPKAFENIAVSVTNGFQIQTGSGYSVSSNEAHITRMEPQGSATITASYIVKRTDLGRDDLECRATASFDGRQISATTDYVEIDAIQESASLTLSVTNRGIGKDGAFIEADVIRYAIGVQNTGNVDLASLTLEEYLSGATIDGEGETAAVPLLEPRGTKDYTASYTVTAADVEAGSVRNTVALTSPDHLIDLTQTAESTTTSEIEDVKAAVAITNTGTGSTGAFIEADVIRYQATVRNDGERTFSNVTVEPMETGFTIENGAGYTVADNKATIATLGPSSVVTLNMAYTVKRTDLGREDIVNRIRTTFDGHEIEAASEAATIDAVRRSVTLGLRVTNTGTGKAKAFYPDDTIRYELTVENTGNVDVANLLVAEELQGALLDNGGKVPSFTIEKLEPKERKTYAAEYTVKAQDASAGTLTNTVRATAEGINQTAQATAQTTDEMDELEAQVTVTNTGTGTGGAFREADVIRYAVNVTNGSTATFAGVTVECLEPGFTIESGAGYSVADNKATIATMGAGTVTITATYTVKRTDLGRSDLVNRTRVSYDGRSIEASSPAVTLEAVRRGVELTLTPTSTPHKVTGTYIPADTVTWTATARNTGNVDVTDLVLTEALAGATIAGAASVNVPVLTPGQTSSAYTCSYTVKDTDTTAGTVKNTIQAAATGVTTSQESSVPCGQGVYKVNASMRETSSGAPYKAGDKVGVELTLANQSTYDLPSITVTFEPADTEVQ